MERSNQQTTDIPSSNKANPMRAGVQNPSGSNYMVAGPTIGGTATPYNPSNIEAAKEHLADSFATKATINDTPSVTDSTLKDTVVSGASTAVHTAADVTKTVVAGAAAAGAATVTAVKNLFADKDTPATTTTDRTGMNPATTTTTHAAMTTNKAQPIADFPHTQVHNLQPDTNPIIQTHTQATTGPINPVPIQEIVEPIHSTGLDRTSTAASGPKTGYRAKEADLHATSGVPASKVDVHPTTKLNQGYNTHHTSTNSPGAIDARPLTDKAAAPVLGAGAAAAGTAAYLGNKTSGLGSESKETARNASLGTPSSTTSSYATMDSTKGTYNPSVSSSTHSTSHTPTTANTSSVPLTEKIKAPVVGAASAIGAAAAGTAAYLGNKDSEAKESVKDTTHNLTSSTKTPAVNNMPASSNITPTSNTYSTSTPIDAPLAKPTAYSTTADPATQHAIAEPMIKTTISSINPVTKSEEIKASTVTPVTEPAIVHSPTLDVYQTTTTGNKHSSASNVDTPMATNTSSSRPMTEKATGPGIGAAAAVGAAAAGTATYLGNKGSDAKNTTKDATKETTHTMSTPSSNHTSTTYNTANTNTYPSSAPSSYTTSNNTTTATAPIMAAGSVPQMTINTTKSQHQQHHPSATANEINTADNIAAAVPASYHGAVPKVGPGEEVVWVKTVTTTDYYDDGTPTGRADVVDSHQEAIDPNTYSTVKDGQIVYNNADQQHDQQDRGASHHM